jgi:hypothetical protein
MRIIRNMTNRFPHTLVRGYLKSRWVLSADADIDTKMMKIRGNFEYFYNGL